MTARVMKLEIDDILQNLICSSGNGQCPAYLKSLTKSLSQSPDVSKTFVLSILYFQLLKVYILKSQ
jgi:hypothetical protein